MGRVSTPWEVSYPGGTRRSTDTDATGSHGYVAPEVAREPPPTFGGGGEMKAGGIGRTLTQRKRSHAGVQSASSTHPSYLTSGSTAQSWKRGQLVVQRLRSE